MILRRLLKQITHLHIDVKNADENNSDIISKIFTLILSLCEKLIELEFREWIPTHLMMIIPSCFFIGNDFSSVTLSKLKISVSCFCDCLFLLDGRFESLSFLIINVRDIFDPVVDIGHKVGQTSRSFQF